ncbi:MAG: hypothetical protein WA364_11695 [Candidatus Nitrosopolaris sp.]
MFDKYLEAKKSIISTINSPPLSLSSSIAMMEKRAPPISTPIDLVYSLCVRGVMNGLKRKKQR